ncbi:M20/M25/M40 family metallo-hydrolase [Clostridium botulinum]|uniref:M20/M25/M40 family metallo-hydrolase n=1 Tax=Clostridium botulinum TaxID=1491 RepID=A0A6G4EG04_CLOBO|nr:M20/M25/M40 family metallo-hydrolase [Clostridium botulinum]APH20001.1 peptidase M20/M25/M40 family protein [Clostridium botulinum]AUM92398.1 peptidase M20 [Clostridium botulinum]NFB12377.1 M20/M25/M40 family metallo-hydrolase [Clostridium botulinum]NFH60028.1 M20/M25/M40 family metallo-hydrolase [Clostridium botulinum]NFH62120.1 M20/M25/M40 family metallo-hydrolase [Clostridium botulinum]
MMMRDKIFKTLDRLVKMPSISGTEKENLAVDEIYNILIDIDYFRNNKSNVKVHNIEGDMHNRCFLTALLEGKKPSKDIIILTGHLDVVDIDEFGILKNIAFDYKEYTKRVSDLVLDQDSKKDLHSNEWIFGRGTADMKYGLALYIELIRELSRDRDFKGNILFLAVPGEESNSEGMLGAIPYLSKLKEEGYNFKSLFLSECCIPKYEGDNAKRIYIGSVGKIMPTFFCVGKATHVGNPFGGLNPNLLVSEINKLMEYNVELSDKYEKDITPPPVCLKQSDLKELYSVQNPVYAYSYYNLLTIQKTPEEIMENLKDIAREAFYNTLKIIKENYKKYKAIYESKLEADLDIEPKIITFEELYKEVLKENKDFEKYIETDIEKWKEEKLDNQTIGIKIIKETFEHYKYQQPMIIIAYNVPYYPHRYFDSENPKYTNLLNSLDNMGIYAKEKYNVNIEKENFFMGISDLSYTGLDEKFNIESICGNMPGLGYTYKFPEKELKKFDIPSVVFGGFGKDFHKYTERLNIPYSMDIVPELYMYILKEMLQ